MEERAIDARLDLVDDIGLEVDVERARDVLAGAGLGEEGAEAAVVCGRRVVRETAVGLMSRILYEHRDKRG